MHTCDYHEERGIGGVEATHHVNNEWLCDACWHGKAVFPEEETGDPIGLRPERDLRPRDRSRLYPRAA